MRVQDKSINQKKGPLCNTAKVVERRVQNLDHAGCSEEEFWKQDFLSEPMKEGDHRRRSSSQLGFL
jgi:hypothetical protein